MQFYKLVIYFQVYFMISLRYAQIAYKLNMLVELDGSLVDQIFCFS